MFAIILPVYNSSLYLNECIESILNQTYDDFVVYAVDDGSTDDSLEILKQFQKRDSRIKIFSKNNGGVSSARNVALSALDKETRSINYVLFVDSDDILDKRCLEICSKEMPGVDILIGSFTRFSGNSFYPTFNSVKTKQKLNQAELCDRYFHLKKWSKGVTSDYFLCNKCFAYQVIRGVRFNEKLKRAEDQDVMLKLLPNIRDAVLLPENLYFYRVRDNSLSHSEKYEDFTDELRVYKSYLSRKDYPNCVREGIQHRYIQKLWTNMSNILNSSLDLKAKNALYVSNKDNLKVTFDYPLTKKEKKRLLLLQMGFWVNLVLSTCRKKKK